MIFLAPPRLQLCAGLSPGGAAGRLFFLHFSMTPQIFIHSDFSRPDFLRLDVLAQHLPRNFLGVAFDLVVPGTWTFDREELCGSFASAGSGVFHLVSARPQDHRVVFGMAKAGDAGPTAGAESGSFVRSGAALTGGSGGTLLPQVGAPSGAVGQTQAVAQTEDCLARFYFRFSEIPKKMEVLFERTSLSAYENGRRDLANVQWSGIEVIFPGGQIQAATEGRVGDFTQVVAATQTSQAQQAGPIDVFEVSDSGLVNVYQLILAFLVVVLAGFGLCLLYYRLRRQR